MVLFAGAGVVILIGFIAFVAMYGVPGGTTGGTSESQHLVRHSRKRHQYGRDKARDGKSARARAVAIAQ